MSNPTRPSGASEPDATETARGDATPAVTPRTPRRAPSGTERKRDPERTKARILEAAVQEFSAHGYAGTRTSRIARGAGVNQQLISYYFGGKEGLYQALGNRWRAQEGYLDAPEAPLSEVVARYVHATIDQPELTRLFAWAGLDGGEAPEPARAERMRSLVAEFARRRDDGELALDVDPYCLALILLAAVAAPVTYRPIARELGITEPTSAEFADEYADQLARLVARLSDSAS